eukprot:4903373-Pyramimonas_sp.AAC.1
MQQCFAPRTLEESGHFSFPIQPRKAMVAGLRSASLSRCILHRTLERMCEARTPVIIKSWVDDLNTRITAAPKFGVDPIKVATVLRDDCKELDLIISPKSNILSSSVLAGVALAANLK